jgi:photosystem II stability/assembly factor-like uncharacterized protein
MHSLKFTLMTGGLAVLLILTACCPIEVVAPPPLATSTPLTVQATATPMPTATATVTTTATMAPSFSILPSPPIHFLDMLNVQEGWALTDAAVLRTKDGGLTWYNVTPSRLSGAPASSFFLNNTTGWVGLMGADPTTGMLFHTTDGGANWSSVVVPFGDGSLKFVDPMHGWEMIGLGAGMFHEAVAVYRTGDGGTTWEQVIIDDPTVSGYSDSLPLEGDKNGITALDADRGWVTGQVPMSDFIYLYATQDGGRTWFHQDLALPDGYSGAETNADLPVFFGTNNAVLPVKLYANNNGADFYVSHDGGQTWAATTPVSQGGFMAVASAADFFVWDGSAPLNVSHDGGVTWLTFTPNVNIKDNMVSLQFVNATTGWALTSDVNYHRMLYRTTDGGETWNVLIP